MTTGGSATVAQWQLAQAITELRGQCAQRDVAQGLDIYISTLSRWEGAESVPREKQLRKLLSYLDADEATVTRIMELRSAATALPARPGADISRHYAQYIELERSADRVASYQDRFVPGLLQTKDYARASIEAGHPHERQGYIDKLIEIRLQRQQEWLEAGRTQLWAIIDESVLTRHVGGTATIAAQVHHLREMSRHPQVTLQVVPFTTGAHAALHAGSFSLVTVAKPPLEVVYVETRTRTMLQDDPQDVAAHTLLLDHLRAAAISITDTRQILDRVSADFER